VTMDDASVSGAQAGAAFGKILGLSDPSPDDDLVEALAVTLGVPEAIRAAALEASSPAITAGELSTLRDAIDAFARAAGAEDAALAGRLAALGKIYGAEVDKPEGDRLSAARLQVLSLAASRIGRIRSAVPDPEEPGRRYGWQLLADIFASAFGEKRVDLRSVERLDAGPGQKLMPWCGLLTLWAYKTAGLEVGDWCVGQGIARVSGIKAVGKDEVLPGDVGVIGQPFQHHFLVVGVDGDAIVSIDGNSVGSDDLHGGQVVFRHDRTIGHTSAFYRPSALE